MLGFIGPSGDPVSTGHSRVSSVDVPGPSETPTWGGLPGGLGEAGHRGCRVGFRTLAGTQQACSHCPLASGTCVLV